MSARDRLRRIEERIERSCRLCGRSRRDVTLVAVSKSFSVASMLELYELGQRHFGESRLQEAEPKIAAMPMDCVWHFVGKLQSNKVRKAAEHFDVLQTIESESQLRELAKSTTRRDVLIEINIAREPQKSGVFPESLDAFVEKVLYCETVRLKGLMTIGAVTEDVEKKRAWFRSTRQLLERIPGGEWVSMGMSSDFDVAIQEGATHIRIGSALFGERR